MKIPVKIGLLAVLFIVVLAAFFLPALGKVRAPVELRIRKMYLVNWYKETLRYVHEKEAVPSALYEVARYSKRMFQVKVAIGQDPNVNYIRMIEDPNYYNAQIEYAIAKQEKGWFIRELKPGEIYKKMLMIDQDGKFY
jgi:hypothetical protein